MSLSTDRARTRDDVRPSRKPVRPPRRAVGSEPGRAPQQSPVTAATQPHRLSWWVVALLCSLVVPYIMQLGSLAMPPYKVVLLVTLLPCTFMVLTGQAGRIRLADVALVLYCAWTSVCLVVAHGPNDAVEPVGSLFIETMGAYLLARCFVRTVDDYFAMAKLLFCIVCFVLFPMAIVESVTHRNYVLEFFNSIGESNGLNYQPPRLGLRRVQTVFVHPILFGVFCGSILASTHLVVGYGKNFAGRAARSFPVFLSALLSLSSGPITTMFAQILLLMWDRVLGRVKNRWWIFMGLLTSSVTVLQLMAHRPLAAVLFSWFALDEASAYFRLLIWEYGSQSVLNHPLFGVGFGEWDRPIWMPKSIDMFWLVNAVVGGLPGGVLMLAAFFGLALPVALKTGLDERTHRCRLAYLISMSGIFLVGWMVHFWGETYILIVFLLGSSAWILDSPASNEVLTTSRDKRVRERKAPASRRQKTTVRVPARARVLRPRSDSES